MKDQRKIVKEYLLFQREVTAQMRAVLVDWLVDVCEEFHQPSEVVHLAVS